MKAISLIPGTTNVSLVDIPEPGILQPDEIKLRVLEVGICGTDREEVSGGRADAPEGKKDLVIGHEMFGEVTEVGTAVTEIRAGDFGLFTVRRGCNECLACLNNRSDLCYTGKYTERGIKGADGFEAEFVVDRETYFVKVPPSLREIGVLTEPMSVAAKAIDEALLIQGARLKSVIPSGQWLDGKKALVAGIGPIGLMAAFGLRLRGAEVIGVDVVDENSLRPQLLKEIGGTYVDGRKLKITDLDDAIGESDFIFEATGIASLQIELIDALAINGIYVATGIPGGSRPVTIDAAGILQQMVLKNQIMLGSVNASIHHYRMAVEDLEASLKRWPESIKRVITEKVPFMDFKKVFENHSADEIKVVVSWG